MGMELWFVRHGRTSANRSFIIYGRIDVPLDEVGIKQAQDCRRTLKGESFDAIYCSPLTRARQTAEIVTRDISAPAIQYDERILERAFGNYEGLWRPLTMMKLWSYDRSYTKSRRGEENILGLEIRVHDFLEEMQKKHEGQKILVVAHSGVATMMDAILNDRERAGWFFKHFHMDNGAVSKFYL